MISRSLWCVLLLLPLAAYAEPPKEKLALATELVKLLRFDRMFDDYLVECSKPGQAAADAEAAYRAEPDSFGGLTPKSAYWKDVVEIYARLRSTSCQYADGEKVTLFFARQIAERSSEADLRASIAFHSSPAGKRMQAVALEANKNFQMHVTELMRSAADEAQRNYHREMTDLMRRIKVDPR